MSGKAVVIESTDKNLYDAFMEGGFKLEHVFCTAVEEVLQIMLKNHLTQVADRQAVWYKKRVFIKEVLVGDFLQKIGVEFPSQEFEGGCRLACKEKVARTENNPEDLCSHESRNPTKNSWGGAAKIFIQLISSYDGKIYEATVIGAPSGLKEWEDLVLELATYYYLGLLTYESEQFQEIMRRAIQSVANDSGARPKNISLAEYAKKVFDAIDESRAKKA